MDVDILKICGVGVLCSIVGALIGSLAGGAAVAVRLCGLAFILGGAVALLGEIAARVSLMGDGVGGEYISLMLKGLGVVTLGRICADVCRECGENNMASAVEVCASLTVLVLALPSVFGILDAVDGLLSEI